MITWKMVLLAIYLTAVVGIFIMNALYVSDLKKFRDEKIKEGEYASSPVRKWKRLLLGFA